MAASVCVCALGVVIAISEDGANDMVANNAATAYIDGAVTIFDRARRGHIRAPDVILGVQFWWPCRHACRRR